jgi:hypothetical protein
MQIIDKIKSFLNNQPKCKLVVITTDDYFAFVNVGQVLSEYLVDKLSSPDISLKSYTFLIKELGSSVYVHPELGEYIALKNSAILQEPELKIDVLSVLEQLSKSCLLIVDKRNTTIELSSIPHMTI